MTKLTAIGMWDHVKGMNPDTRVRVMKLIYNTLIKAHHDKRCQDIVEEWRSWCYAQKVKLEGYPSIGSAPLDPELEAYKLACDGAV